MKRIVCTMPNGGVAVVSPAPQIMRVMTLGGGFLAPGRRDIAIDANVRNHGLPEYLAVKFVDALIDGGLTDAEAYGLIRDRDANKEWTGAELWTLDDLPGDRWFRDAWRRSHNGGPIEIEMRAARKIQALKLVSGKDRRLKRLHRDAEVAEMAGETFEEASLRMKIERLTALNVSLDLSRAQNPEALKAVWPF